MGDLQPSFHETPGQLPRSLFVRGTSLILDPLPQVSNTPEIFAQSVFRTSLGCLAEDSLKPMGYSVSLGIPHSLSQGWLGCVHNGFAQVEKDYRLKCFHQHTFLNEDKLVIMFQFCGGTVPGDRSAERLSAGDHIYMTHPSASLHTAGKGGAGESPFSHIPETRFDLAYELSDFVHANFCLGDKGFYKLVNLCAYNNLLIYLSKKSLPLPGKSSVQDFFDGYFKPELIFTCSPEKEEHLRGLSQKHQVQITKIGHLSCNFMKDPTALRIR